MTTAEKYIYQVYAEQSFSRAAESLFISQPSLSTAVARKERELGFAIFDRTTKPITLTPQGQIYLDMLEEMLESEKNMQMRVQRLSSDTQNVIGIGGGLSTGYYLLPEICGALHREYPEVEMMMDLGNLGATTSLPDRLSHFQRLDRGEIDTVLCYEYNTDKYVGEVIYNERLVAAMHRELAPAALLPYAVSREELLGGCYPAEREIGEKNLFRTIPFFDFLPNSSTGRFMTELLGEYAPSPCKLSHARHTIVHFNMMCAGVAALMTSDCLVRHVNIVPADVMYFVFPAEHSTRKIYLVTKKNQPLNPTVQRFTAVAKRICAEI